MAARLDELLAGDLPIAMVRELKPHVASCRACSAELASFRRLSADLRALPLESSPARSWSAIQWAIESERREQPLPWVAQVALLAAAGLVVATALVRNSGLIADQIATLSAARFPGWLADATAVASPWRPFVLPGLFLLFGAVSACIAWPLLATRERPRLLALATPRN